MAPPPAPKKGKSSSVGDRKATSSSSSNVGGSAKPKQPTLVAEKGSKQIQKRPPEVRKLSCRICFEYTDVNKMFSVDICFHKYCISCMKKHVKAKFLIGMMAECPHEHCHSEVKIECCKNFFDPKLFDLIKERRKESVIPVSEKVYCPNPRCSALMSKGELKYMKVYSGEAWSGARRCVKCQSLFCVNCKVLWHEKKTCHDYKQSAHCSGEESLLMSLAKQKLWRQCVKCNHMIELDSGCYHITCGCGHEFCYTCGAPWINKKATCKCRLWDEHHIIRGQ